MQGVVKPWVEDCVKNHPGCREVQQLDFGNRAPTRLIDVGTAYEDAVKLVDTGGLSNPRYLIMSYCWGASNDESKTTQANIEQRRESIQIAALPKAIGDVIAITRLMGVQYLWVDAMCIIQETNDGFLDDWKIEAAKMASYYSNALCCVSNLSAKDSSEGFLQGNHQKWGLQGVLKPKLRAEQFIYQGHTRTIYLPEPVREWDIEWESSPLMRRAWALQEWILSRRILHCTKDGMFMECGRGVCQPNDPFTKPVAAWHHTQGNEISNILRESAEAQVGDLWMKLVTFYSTMNLTNPTDRLVAIDGIARLICAKYNVGYFAGVLSSHVAQMLLWKCNKPKDEVNSSNFPSWSWASTTDVKFPEVSKYTSYIRCIDDGCFRLSDRVVSYADPSTRLLPLRGPLWPVSVVSQDTSPWPGGGDDLCLICNGPFGVKINIYCYMDSTKERTELEQWITDRVNRNIPVQLKLLVCLESIAERKPWMYKSACYGLIVEELKDSGANAYERIGFFSTRIKKYKHKVADFDLGAWETDINLF